jgi:hypothetical protein
MRAKLTTSCLTAKDATLLKFQAYTATELQKHCPNLPHYEAAFKIPYFDLHGKPTQFYRVRYLPAAALPKTKGFEAVATQRPDDEKPLRYTQPKETLNEIYLPPFVEWAELAVNVAIPIIITEGELKAACATRHGLPTIGLGGVWSFKSAKAGYAILPQFKEFVWKERVAYVCYDSDAATNTQVQKAELELCKQLIHLGALPYICRIPPAGGGGGDEKVGLDDFIAKHTSEVFKRDILERAGDFRSVQELYALNAEVAFVNDPGFVVRLDTLQKMSPGAFADAIYAPRRYYETLATANGGAKLVERSVAKEWIKWEHRSTCERMTYDPSQPPITARRELNTWRGFPIEPEEGDVAFWNAFLTYLFPDKADAEHKKWFEQWIAHHTQRPWEKMYTAVVLWSVKQGTGKSTVGYILQRLLGDNWTEIKQKDLFTNHNEWAENKISVLADEIQTNEGYKAQRAMADALKNMVTQRTLRLNPKYIPSYTMPDRLNYVFTSNHPDAFLIDNHDRRFFIHEVTSAPLGSEQFKKNFLTPLDAEGGRGTRALLHHLQHVSMEGFDPQGHAPVTRSRQNMIQQNQSPLGAWVADLKEAPDDVLYVAGLPMRYKLWTAAELFQVFETKAKKDNDDKGSGLNSVIMGRELARNGFRQVHDGQLVRVAESGANSTLRLWAIRDPDNTLLGLTPEQLAAQYNSERGNKPKPKRKPQPKS